MISDRSQNYLKPNSNFTYEKKNNSLNSEVFSVTGFI